MSRIFNMSIPVTLLLSVLALSACSTTPEAVPDTAPVVAVTEQPSVAEATPEPVLAPAPAQAAITEQPKVSTLAAPKKKVRKAKKAAVKKPAPVATPEPEVAPAPEPAPVIEQAAPATVQAEPTPPVTMAPPAKPMAEAGFFEEYWLWIIGLLIVIGGFIALWWRKNANQS